MFRITKDELHGYIVTFVWPHQKKKKKRNGDFKEPIQDLPRTFHAHPAPATGQILLLPRCMFIDGTVLRKSRPGNYNEQHTAYNGCKRKHVSIFQTITTPNGLTLHAYGSMAECRHDLALCNSSEMDRKLGKVLEIEREQVCIHENTGYNDRAYLDVPFQGAALTLPRRAATSCTDMLKVTVEWMYQNVKLYWATVDLEKMKSRQSAPELLTIAAMLLANLSNCLYSY